MKIALTGASGFVGTHLRERFKDHVILARGDSVAEIHRKLRGVDAVVNLAGAPIMKRWSGSHKRLMWESRISTTRKVVEAMEKSDVPRLISTSAVGIYPDDTECSEDCPHLADDFLGSLAKAWEEEAFRFSREVTVLRFGIILGREGGALGKMLLPFRLGLGGPIGDGSMMMSWLHIDDLMEIYKFVLERRITGVVNAVAPRPVTNREFTAALSRAVGMPAFIPVPSLLLRLIFGEGATVLTASKVAVPRRLMDAGFDYGHGEIGEALDHIINGSR